MFFWYIWMFAPISDYGLLFISSATHTNEMALYSISEVLKLRIIPLLCYNIFLFLDFMVLPWSLPVLLLSSSILPLFPHH